MSEGTVRSRLENIYRRPEVSSRTAAVTRAFADRDDRIPPFRAALTRATMIAEIGQR